MSLVCRSCRYVIVCNDRCPPQLQFINKFVIFLFVAQRLIPMVHTARRTTGTSQLRVDKVFDAPFSQVVQISFVAQRHIPMVQTARRTVEISQLLVKVVDALICSWCEFHRCRRGQDSCAPTVAPAQ